MNHWHYMALMGTATEWLENQGFRKVSDTFLELSWNCMPSEVKDNVPRAVHDSLIRHIVDIGRTNSASKGAENDD